MEDQKAIEFENAILNGIYQIDQIVIMNSNHWFSAFLDEVNTKTFISPSDIFNEHYNHYCKKINISFLSIYKKRGVGITNGELKKGLIFISNQEYGYQLAALLANKFDNVYDESWNEEIDRIGNILAVHRVVELLQNWKLDQEKSTYIIPLELIDILFERYHEYFKGETLETWRTRFKNVVEREPKKLNIEERYEKSNNKSLIITILGKVDDNYPFRGFPVRERFGLNWKDDKSRYYAGVDKRHPDEVQIDAIIIQFKIENKK